MREIKESDWKILREVYPTALERFCERILSEVGKIQSDNTESFHRRYMQIFKLLQTRDKAIALAFDDIRRSNAVHRLMAMKFADLLTEDEFSRFSQETRDRVTAALEHRQTAKAAPS